MMRKTLTAAFFLQMQKAKATQATLEAKRQNYELEYCFQKCLLFFHFAPSWLLLWLSSYFTFAALAPQPTPPRPLAVM